MLSIFTVLTRYSESETIPALSPVPLPNRSDSITANISLLKRIINPKIRRRSPPMTSIPPPQQVPLQRSLLNLRFIIILILIISFDRVGSSRSSSSFGKTKDLYAKSSVLYNEEGQILQIEYAKRSVEKYYKDVADSLGVSCVMAILPLKIRKASSSSSTSSSSSHSSPMNCLITPTKCSLSLPSSPPPTTPFLFHPLPTPSTLIFYGPDPSRTLIRSFSSRHLSEPTSPIQDIGSDLELDRKAVEEVRR